MKKHSLNFLIHLLFSIFRFSFLFCLKYSKLFIIIKCFSNLFSCDTNFLNNKITNQSQSNKIENSPKKNVILGLIANYPIETVLPFFRSFTMANFSNCDIVMFVRDVSPELLTYLENLGVYIHIIPEKYINISIINLRWKMYTDYLEKNPNKYNLVLATDVRDTIFQKDIFSYLIFIII